MRNVPFSPPDEQVISRWYKMHGRTVFLWCFFLLLFFPFTVIAFFFFLQGKIDLTLVLVFIPFELFFVWKVVETVQKKMEINSVLRKGLKQITTGKLLELKTSRGNCLKYNIDNNTIKVNAPGPFNGLIESKYLKDAKIQLETVAITKTENLLLDVQYPDIPSALSGTAILSPEDVKERDQKNKKDNRYMLKIMGFILPAIGIALLWVNGITYLPLIFSICLAMALTVFLATMIVNRRIEGFKEKLIIRGTITEVIESRYKIGKSTGFRIMYWYRLGSEMLQGYLDNSEKLIPGDKACFEYYVNTKGERIQLISIIKIV